MSVKLSLLALLTEGPQYGAWLRQEFEARTGGTWPLNVGQVYTTLSRLERDALVVPAGPRGEDGTIRYGLTDAGRQAVRQWWDEPVDRTASPRDELAIKLALAVTVPGVDVPRLVQAQRTATVSRLQGLTQLKRSTDAEADLAWVLVLENLIFSAEAEVRWLDHIESRVARAGSGRRVDRSTQSTGSGPAQGADPEPVASTSGADHGH